MEVWGSFMEMLVNKLDTKFSVYGYEISFWQIILFEIAALILVFIIGELIDIGD